MNITNVKDTKILFQQLFIKQLNEQGIDCIKEDAFRCMHFSGVELCIKALRTLLPKRISTLKISEVCTLI
jgi:hypothetical protein